MVVFVTGVTGVSCERLLLARGGEILASRGFLGRAFLGTPPSVGGIWVWA